MPRTTKKQTGSALAFVVLILGVIVLALIFFHSDLEKTFREKPQPHVHVKQYIERETHFFSHDDYVVRFVIWSDEAQPLSGRIRLYISKEYGHFRPLSDDLAKDGEIDESSATIRVYDWKPGNANAKTVYYQLDSPKLAESNLSSEDVVKRAPLLGSGDFDPFSNDLFKSTTLLIGFGDGS